MKYFQQIRLQKGRCVKFAGRGIGQSIRKEDTMNEIYGYTVIYDQEVEKVIQEVREAIKAGWQPLGGISACRAENDTYANTVYAQAMVMYQ